MERIEEELLQTIQYKLHVFMGIENGKFYVQLANSEDEVLYEKEVKIEGGDPTDPKKNRR